MKSFLVAGAACALALALSGCAGFSVPGMTGATAANNAFASFLTDPNCSHHDEATLITGAAGMPASFQAKAVRDCPAHPVAVVAPGAVIGAPAAP